MTRTLVGAADPPERSEKRTERPPLNGVREAPFTLRSDDGEESDGLTLDGYGAVFNRLTAIDSWEGRFREQIAPGAMNRSFRETPPIVQFDHGRSSPIGSIPIAKVERIAEESDPVLAPEGGAHIVARLFDNWLVQPVRDAIAAGAISGMSFRFSVVREAWAYADGSPIRSEDALREEFGAPPSKAFPTTSCQFAPSRSCGCPRWVRSCGRPTQRLRSAYGPRSSIWVVWMTLSSASCSPAPCSSWTRRNPRKPTRSKTPPLWPQSSTRRHPTTRSDPPAAR